MLRKFILFSTVFFTSVSLFAQAKLIEKVTKKSASDVVIPYEKYMLPNGLTVLIHEDHSDPLVHVDVTYHVGSAREEISKSGFAHFFEHMMFQGSDNVADEQHFKIITEAGGVLNGTTNKDRTNYFETVPSNQLEKMLWLESDRMGFLLDAVTQKKFEVQRATVKNERGQNYDNKPYGLVQETLAKNLYPYGHPYSWLTIGYIEDLNRVNVQDLKNFFLRWYGPNNAVLTVGGDVDVKEVLALATKYFGSIPKCPTVTKTILPQPKIEQDRYASMVDDYAKLPQLICAMPTVSQYNKDEVALDCLAEIIGGSNTSILYQKLVKTQKALSASSYHPTDELAGTFQFSITPKPGTPLADMEKAVREAIAEFEKKGITDDDLAKFKASREANLIYSLESVSGKVSKLASYFTFTGNGNYIKTEMERNSALTKKDVMRVYDQYIKGKKMVILSVLTKGNEKLIAHEDNYKVNQANYKAPNYGYDKLTYVKAKDNFDRSKMPIAKEASPVKLPMMSKAPNLTINNIIAENNEVPIVVFSIGLKGGRLVEQSDLNKVGLTNMFTAMMDEDTKKHTSEEMSTMLDKLGSSISFETEFDEIRINVRCLTKNFNATMALLEERLLEPKFTQEAFDRIKNQTIESIKNSKTRATNVANIAYSKLNYGKESIFGLPMNGTVESVSAIQLKDIEDYYNSYISQDGARFVEVGDISSIGYNPIQEMILKLPTTKIELPNPVLPTVENNGTTIYLVNIPKAAQTEFRVGYVTGLTYDAMGEYYKNSLMNFPLGGAFNSRINLNLREDKGWTYGARSNFVGNDYTGNYTFSSGIKANVTDSALIEVMKEIKNYKEEGIKADEFSFMKNAISQSEARKYETLSQKAGLLYTILKYDLDNDYTTKQNEILKNISMDEINTLAKKWLQDDKMKIVLAGDKAKIAPGLEKLGYTIIDVDANGEVVSPSPSK
jgi:zinc protease